MGESRKSLDDFMEEGFKVEMDELKKPGQDPEETARKILKSARLQVAYEGNKKYNAKVQGEAGPQERFKTGQQILDEQEEARRKLLSADDYVKNRDKKKTE